MDTKRIIARTVKNKNLGWRKQKGRDLLNWGDERTFLITAPPALLNRAKAAKGGAVFRPAALRPYPETPNLGQWLCALPFRVVCLYQAMETICLQPLVLDFTPLFYSYILSKWFKIPMVTIAHGDDFIVQNPLIIKTYILNNIQRIIVTNRIMKELMLKVHHVSSEIVDIIHLGVDVSSSKVEESVSDLRNKFCIKDNDYIILTVSRFYPRKGFDTVLRAIKLIIDTCMVE